MSLILIKKLIKIPKLPKNISPMINSSDLYSSISKILFFKKIVKILACPLIDIKIKVSAIISDIKDTNEFNKIYTN